MRPELRRDARKHSDRFDRHEQPVGQAYVGRGRPGRWQIGHVPRVNLVEPAEVLDIGVEDRRLDHVLHRRSRGGQHGGEIEQCLLRLASIPSGIVPVSGSIPAIPEQKTNPPATIAWLYGPIFRGLVARYCPSGHRPLLSW